MIMWYYAVFLYLQYVGATCHSGKNGMHQQKLYTRAGIRQASAPITHLRPQAAPSHTKAFNYGRLLIIYQRMSFLSEWHAAPIYKGRPWLFVARSSTSCYKHAILRAYYILRNRGSYLTSHLLTHVIYGWRDMRVALTYSTYPTHTCIWIHRR